MKKTSILFTGVAALLLLAVATPTFAAEGEKDKTVTLTGSGTCGKCALHETEKCHNVLQVENKKGKKVNYFLTQNDISKGFHDNICKGPKKITVTGTVKTEDGKKVLTATKIALAKE